MGDVSKTYKIWYDVWLSKEAQRFIDDVVANGLPPPSLEDAKKIIQSYPEHEVKFRESELYEKYVVRGSTKRARNATTSDRFTASVLEKRAQQIMKEKPELSEEQAMKQADTDVQTRQKNEATDVAESADPVAAKILTNIASILMDISEDVIAIRESGPKGLDAAEAGREKDKDGKPKLTKEEEAETAMERLAKLVTIFLIPMFLGFMSKFVDLTSLSGMLITAFVGLIAYLGSTKLLTALFTVIRGLFTSLSDGMDNMLGGVFGRTKPPSTAPSVPDSSILTGGTTAPTSTPVPNAPGVPGAPGAPGAPNTVSSLTTLGQGIRDLGAGAGDAIKSILTGITDGFKYMGDKMVDVMKGALALGAIAVAFIPFAYSLKLLKDVNVGAVLAATIGIALISASVIALGNAGDSIYRGLLALTALGIAFAPFAFSLKLLKDVNVGAVLAATLGIGVVSAAVIALGNAGNSVYKGVLALAALGGAMAIFGAALSTVSGINGGELLKVGAALVGFGLAAAVLGGALANIALGSLAIALLGGALFIFGNALETISGINGGDLLKVGAGLLGFGLVAAGLGLMFPMIALGAAAMVVLAGGLMVIGKALEVAAPSLESAAESIKKLGEIDGSNLLKLGLAAAGLGLMFPMIALGAAAMTILAGGLMVVGKALELVAPSLDSATESIKKLNEIDGSNLLEVAKGIAGIGLVAVGLGLMFPVIALGAGAMTILAGGLTILGKALELVAPSLDSATESIKKLNEIDGSNLLNLGAGLFSFGLAAAGLGLMFPMIALGAVAMVVLAGGVTVLGKALEIVAPSLESAAESINKFGDIDGNNLLTVAKGIAGIGLAMVGFSAAMLASSAMGVGSAILGFFADSPLENLLEFAEDAKDVDVAGAAAAVSKLTKAIKQLDSISGANLFNIGAGLAAVSAGIVAFSASNVAAGLGNLVTKFLSFLGGGKTPVEQIIELSEKHKQIFEAGKGVESMGKGLSSFNSLDADKIEKTIKIIATLDDEQLEKLAKVASIGGAGAPAPTGTAPTGTSPSAPPQVNPAPTGTSPSAPPQVNPVPTGTSPSAPPQVNPVPTQPMQTEKLNDATQGSRQTPSNAPPAQNNTVVNQNAVNNSSVNYSGNRMGSAVQGDALAAMA